MIERELDGVFTVDYHHSLLRARQSVDLAVVQVYRTRLELVHLMARHDDGALLPGIELLLQCSLRRELLLQDLLNRRSSVVDDLIDVVLRLHPGTVDLRVHDVEGAISEELWDGVDRQLCSTILIDEVFELLDHIVWRAVTGA